MVTHIQQGSLDPALSLLIGKHCKGHTDSRTDEPCCNMLCTGCCSSGATRTPSLPPVLKAAQTVELGQDKPLRASDCRLSKAVFSPHSYPAGVWFSQKISLWASNNGSTPPPSAGRNGHLLQFFPYLREIYLDFPVLFWL